MAMSTTEPDQTSQQRPRTITPTHSLILDEPISCLSFVPGNERLLLVGTYQLLEAGSEDQGPEDPQTRKGKVYVLRVTDDELYFSLPAFSRDAIFELEEHSCST